MIVNLATLIIAIAVTVFVTLRIDEYFKSEDDDGLHSIDIEFGGMSNKPINRKVTRRENRIKVVLFLVSIVIIPLSFYLKSKIF